ncbi:MAG: barstar family protein [Elusimicrobia bacterium]|nr:barstar family protein [Elusimicrobiota bacterium]
MPDDSFLAAADPPHLADLDAAEAAELRLRAAALGFAVFELDAARMQTKPELMDQLAEALKFPGDFGRNWDATVDCLGDLAGIHGGKKFLVVVKDPAALERADPRLYADFREVCGLACENARQWSGGSVRLKFAFAAS